MTRLRLSKHFTVEEFDCHNGQRVPRNAEAHLRSLCVHVLEPMRDRFGPISVSSGFRPLTYNLAIGSTAGSYHVYERRVVAGPPLTPAAGVAADVVPARGDPRKWVAWAEAHRVANATLRRRAIGGVGVYPRSGFVHVDTGPRRSWAG